MGRSDTRNAAATAGANLKGGKKGSDEGGVQQHNRTHTKQAAWATSKEQKQAHEQKETDKDWRDEEMGSGRPERAARTGKGKVPKRRKVETKAATQ